MKIGLISNSLSQRNKRALPKGPATLPAGVELRSDGDLSVLSIVAASKAEEETPIAAEEGEEAAEPGAEGAEPAAEGGGDEKSGD